MERKVLAWTAMDASGILSPYTFTLRKTGPEDLVLKVLFCGVDRTDLHQMRNELHMTVYPLVPGHEVVGEVLEVGSDVTRFAVGDLAGVGCIVGSCGSCRPCAAGMENYCSDRVFTYNGTDVDGRPTRGGFASAMIVNQRFAVRIPPGLAPEQAAPLLCAGVTAYSPLAGLLGGGQEGPRGGVLGLGGVGHLAVRMAKAMGHHVTVISSSDRKREEALVHLGADAYLVSGEEAAIADAAESLDYILDTVPAAHPLDRYLSLLKPEGRLVLVGAAPEPLQFQSTSLLLGRKTITGSFIGSIKETEECLNFWATKGLTSMIEVVKMEYVNKAFERMEKNDVRYRFVLDIDGSSLA